MDDSEKNKSDVEQAGEDLFNFAIDRDDTKWLLSRLPPECNVKPGKVEYELQILKIISVGWSIPYFLENSPLKTPLLELYWQSFQEFSAGINETTGLMTGIDIDYFQLVKDRLDTYVSAMSGNSGKQEPAAVIGPEFAGACGNKEDIFARMTGTKMFVAAVDGVREYLEAIKWI